jgi:hypothetical protein
MGRSFASLARESERRSKFKVQGSRAEGHAALCDYGFQRCDADFNMPFRTDSLFSQELVAKARDEKKLVLYHSTGIEDSANSRSISQALPVSSA